uniref:Uncharacterized protein n=1 Tax=Acrobeloides nanus TaxID=290746 RepID=A0A914E900_9BILA
MKFWILFFALLAIVYQAFSIPINMDPEMQEQALRSFYRSMLIKSKRSPSIGLSLAEYMASPQGEDSFHFIPGGRK